MNGTRKDRKPRNIDVIQAQSKIISQQADIIETMRKTINYLNDAGEDVVLPQTRKMMP